MKVIHLLNWKLETIEKELENIKKQGFDAIQINSMQPFKEEKEFKWWSSYQPLGFRIGNMFGNKEDLKRLCSKAREHGLDVIVDVVLNHTANNGADDPFRPHESVDKELRNEKSFWKAQRGVNNWDDRFEVTGFGIGLPGLDLNNKDLQEIIFAYLKELKECGVKGLRFDAAKHIGLPSDGVDFFKKVRKFMFLNNMYGYGEVLGDNKQWREFRDEMAKFLMVLSPRGTTLEHINKLMTFYESHDTYLNIGDSNPNNTRDLTDHDLIYIYSKLRNMYKNTILYTRPLDENNPYCRNKDGLTCDEVYKLDENEYFNRVYLDSSLVRDINKQDTPKKLILARK